MSVTESLRKVIADSSLTCYRIGKDTGVSISIVDRFLSRQTDPKGTTIDKLCDYFGLELVQKRPVTSVKQAAKSTRTAAKKPRKPTRKK